MAYNRAEDYSRKFDIAHQGKEESNIEFRIRVGKELWERGKRIDAVEALINENIRGFDAIFILMIQQAGEDKEEYIRMAAEQGERHYQIALRTEQFEAEQEEIKAKIAKLPRWIRWFAEGLAGIGVEMTPLPRNIEFIALILLAVMIFFAWYGFNEGKRIIEEDMKQSCIEIVKGQIWCKGFMYEGVTDKSNCIYQDGQRYCRIVNKE
jgi:hypothetical protein